MRLCSSLSSDGARPGGATPGENASISLSCSGQKIDIKIVTDAPVRSHSNKTVRMFLTVFRCVSRCQHKTLLIIVRKALVYFRPQAPPRHTQAVQGVLSRVLTENQLSTLVVNVILPTGRSGNCSCRRSGQNNIRTGAAYLPFPAA